MKYSLLLFLILFCSYYVNSQTQYVEPNGTIYDSSGAPVSFATVKIQYVEINGYAIDYEKTISADINGFYFDSALMTVGKFIRAGALDCLGDTVYGPDQLVVQGQTNYQQDVFICDSTPPILCNGSIQQFVNGNSGFFSVNSTIPNAIFQWDVDGTQYSGSTVTHTFPGPGMYSVCASFSSIICTFTVCDTVIIAGNPISFDLAGQVLKSGTFAQSGLAFLYSSDSTATGSMLIALDTTTIDSGSYYFTNLSAGTYTVQAMLDPNDPDFLNFFPTYFGDEVNWSSATDITLNSSSYQNNINLVPLSAAAPGPGTITGSVIEGPNKAAGPGDPIKNIYVHLRDINGNALEFDLTDNNGDFAFENIAYGDYQLILEIPGQAMVPHAITLSTNQANSNTVFEFDTLGVRVVLGFENELASKTNLYPNPASDLLNIDLSAANIETADIRIDNLQGQVLIRENAELSKFQLNIESLKPGVYFIHISSEKGQFTKKFLVQ